AHAGARRPVVALRAAGAARPSAGRRARSSGRLAARPGRQGRPNGVTMLSRPRSQRGPASGQGDAMAVRVVTDSACDLPDDLIENLGIEVVPLTIRFRHEELLDRQGLSTEEFWRRLTTSDVLPETSAPSAGAFEETFRRLAGDGATGVICINLSSKLSATMQAAQVAAQSVQDACPVAVIDSLSVSMGL